MKKAIFCIIAIASLLTGCKANFPVAQQTGKEDMAYLLFVGQKEYAGKEVQVTIDNAEPFTAKVVKSKKANRRGTQYGIGTGNKNIVVKCDGKTLYQKKIFVSTQEVKQILLP